MANQIIIDIGAVANDGTGDPLRTAFNYVNNNFSNIWATGVANSNIQFDGNRILTTNTNGNLVLAPNGIGKVQANVDIVPNANNTLSLGSLTRQWNTVYARNLTVGGDTTFNNLTVSGNLTVQGNTVQIGNIVTDTKTIQLANTAATANSANGSGITVGANDNIATLLYNSSNNVWTTNIGVSSIGNITAPYLFGNGSQLTGLPVQYGNANVVTLLAGFGANTISTTGNITGGFIFGNISQANGFPATYSNANVVAYGQSGWAGNIIPSGNAVYSLGNATNQWNDLYVSNTTIFMNNVPLSLTAGNVLTVNGNAVLQNNSNSTITTTGNITADYFIGDGSQLSNVASTGDITFVNTTMSAPAGDDIVIQALNNDGGVSSSIEMLPGDTVTRLEQWSSQNSNSWTTSDWATGTYTTEGGGSIGAVQFTGAADILNFVNNLNDAGQVYISINGGPQLAFGGWSGGGSTITFYTPTLPTVDPTTVTSFEYYYSYSSGFEIDYDSEEFLIQAVESDLIIETRQNGDIDIDSVRNLDMQGNGSVTLRNLATDTGIQIQTNINNTNRTWEFGVDGSTIFPTLNVTRGDQTGTLTGQTLLFGDATQEALISTPNGDANANPNSQRFVINPGAGADGTTGEGGDIYLYAGRGGDAGGSGGDIKIRGGLGPVDGNGGYITMEGGEADVNGQGGYIEIIGGVSGNAAGGSLYMYGGQGRTGGDANVMGGFGTAGPGGDVSIIGGGSNNGQAEYGNIIVATGSKNWTFNNTGNLVLPQGGIVYETSIPFGGFTGNTIALKPAGGIDADQQLLIYPTAVPTTDANHLHLTSGNLYNTELFLGDDNLYVKLANTGNIVINSNDAVGNTAQWTFGADGNLTLPQGATLTDTYNISATSYTQASSYLVATGTFNYDAYGGGFAIRKDGGDLDAYMNALGADDRLWTFAPDNGQPSFTRSMRQPTSNTSNDPSEPGVAIWVVNTGDSASLAGTGAGELNTATCPNGTEFNIYVTALGSGKISITKDTYTWTFGSNGNLTLPGNLNAVTASPAPSINGFSSVNAVTLNASGNVTGTNIISNSTLYGNIDIILGDRANASATKTRFVSNTEFSYIQTGNGTVGSTGNIVFSPYSSATQRVVINTASGNLSAVGNITAQNFVGNGAALSNVTVSVAGNIIGTQPNVTLVAGSYSTVFDNTGVATFPGNVGTAGSFVGSGAGLTGVALKTTGSWTVATGTNTYSITVPANGAYEMWVRGNIPNGIITYLATISVTNTNVPVLGTQRAYNYTGGGSPILLVTMPTQIIGAEGTISTAVISGTTNNVFDFVISNTSGSPQTIFWGYVTLS